MGIAGITRTLLACLLVTAPACGSGSDGGEDGADTEDDGDAPVDLDASGGDPDADGDTGEVDPDVGDPAEDDSAGEDAGEEPLGPEPTEDPGWRVRVTTDTALYQLETDCLEAVGTVTAGTELDGWGMNDYWVRVTWTGQHVARADVEILVEPAPGVDPPASWTGTVGLEETGVFTLDGSGCAVEIATALENDAWPAYGLSHDLNFHGYWQVSPDLEMVAVRVLNIPEWIFPWHRAVLLIKEVTEGFLVGGGAIIAPNAILTARHMSIDTEFCYVLAHNAADAWYAGEGVCGTVSEFVTHPEVDIGVVLLSSDETRVPPLAVLDRWVAVGDEFYVVNMSTMHHNHMSDALIDEVDGRNSGIWDPMCTNSWPHGSTYTTLSSVVGGGDSGGPAFIGAGLAGIVHGEACRWPWQPYRQVFVHVPFFETWVADVLAGS